MPVNAASPQRPGCTGAVPATSATKQPTVSRVAREQLAEVTTQTGPDITRYEHAVAERNAAANAAHGLRTDAILDHWYLDEPTARQRVEALETWRSWADGKTVQPGRLAQAAEILADLPDRSVGGFLCHQLERSLPTRRPEPVLRVEQSIGIDLDF